MKHVAIIGIQGVPANYGGFETMVENIIGDNCSTGVQYTIFCSSKDMLDKRETYKNCKLKYIPLRANGMQSIAYDIWSLIKAIKGYDTILVLGVSGCSFLPVFRLLCKSHLIVNMDGMEYQRAKWNRIARWVLHFSESMGIRFADTLITDNKGIQEYVSKTYQRESVLIAYGGDHVLRNVSDDFQNQCLTGYGIEKGGYAITICRIEPENNCHITLEAFARTHKKIVFIGNWKHSDYAKKLKEKYSHYGNILLLDAIYDLDILYVLRSNASLYIHGHSAGGTNPSLVEAMFFRCPIIAYDVIYNRATTEDKALFFSTIEELQDLISLPDIAYKQNTMAMVEIATRLYRWETIAKQYEALY